MQEWLFAQQYGVHDLQRQAVDARTLPISGSMLRGVVALSGPTGRSSALGDAASDCRAQLAQMAPTYVDAVTVFVIVSALKTPKDARARRESLFGAQLTSCITKAVQIPSQDAAKQLSDQVAAFVASLPTKYGIDPKSLGFEGLTVSYAYITLLLRHAGDAAAVDSLIHKGMEIEERNAWGPNWKSAWDKAVAPWYEKPIVLFGLSAAVIAGAYWVSRR